MKLCAKILAALLLFAATAPAWAVLPEEMLSDPILEARARLISQDLRCLVCQNQSIDDSNAGLARDLRLLVRERLKAGDSNEQIVSYVVARYGSYVLLTPPMRGDTMVLWFAPAGILLLAGVVAALFIGANRREAEPLNETERQTLNALMKDPD
jgi:cytochrome c-type biogenesis protein CcmH